MNPIYVGFPAGGSPSEAMSANGKLGARIRKAESQSEILSSFIRRTDGLIFI